MLNVYISAVKCFPKTQWSRFGYKRSSSIQRHSPRCSLAFVSTCESEGVTHLFRVWLQAQCCGVAGADDWGTQIPQSCKCSGGFAGFAGFGSSGCKSRPQVGFKALNHLHHVHCHWSAFMPNTIFCHKYWVLCIKLCKSNGTNECTYPNCNETCATHPPLDQPGTFYVRSL